MYLIMLINVVGILTFISMINTISVSEFESKKKSLFISNLVFVSSFNVMHS